MMLMVELEVTFDPVKCILRINKRQENKAVNVLVSSVGFIFQLNITIASESYALTLGGK
jgi:hypothetical protein